MNGRRVVPNNTTLNRYVTEGLVASSGSLNQNNLVTSLSSVSNLICKKALSISVDIAYLCIRNLTSILVRSFNSGGTDMIHSFKLALFGYSQRLQSYTMRIGVVAKSYDVEYNEFFLSYLQFCNLVHFD